MSNIDKDLAEAAAILFQTEVAREEHEANKQFKELREKNTKAQLELQIKQAELATLKTELDIKVHPLNVAEAEKVLAKAELTNEDEKGE